VSDAATLDRARQALDDHAWDDAYRSFSDAALEGTLSGEDLERLAEAAWWTAHPKECIDALERSYAAHSNEGDTRRAAYVALQLVEDASVRRVNGHWNICLICVVNTQ